MSNKNKNALGTIIFIILFNVGTKFLGFYRDALLGRTLGAGLGTDAYLMALSVTTLIFLSIGSGISTTMIPIIVKEKNKEDRQKIINNILNFILLVSGIIGIIYFFGASTVVSIFATGFSGEKFNLTVQITKILIPTLFFINIAYLFVGILQANEQYIIPTLISVPYNLIIILYLFIGAESFGIIGLAIITVVGWALQMIIQIPKVLSLGQLKYRFKIDFNNHELQVFMKGLLPIVFVMATNQIATVTDNSFISYYGDGKVTTFYYANMLFVAIATIIVYGITAVMFPKFNKSYVENKEQFYNIITTVLEGVILLLIPVGVGIALVSDELISFIFLTEEFNIESVRLTANFLKVYGLFMVAFGIMDIMNKAYYTKNNRKVPVIVTTIILTTNLILNFIFTKVLNVGIYGVVIATALAFYIGIILSLLMFKSDEGNINYRKIFTTIIKTIVSAIVMYLVIIAIQNIMYNSMEVNTAITRIIFIIISGISGVIIYFSSLLILKEKIIINFVKSILNKQ